MHRASLRRYVVRGGHHRRVSRRALRPSWSRTFNPGGFPAQRYPLSALAKDAVDIINELGLGAPGVSGISTGEATAQLLALELPELVSGLVLMATGDAEHARHD